MMWASIAIISAALWAVIAVVVTYAATQSDTHADLGLDDDIEP